MEHRIWSLVRTRWCSDPALPFGNDPPCEVRWRCGSGCPGEGGIPAEWTSVRCSPRCWQTQRSAYVVSSQAESGWVAQSTNGAWGTVSVGGACWAAKRKQHESKVANSGHSEGLLCGVLSGWPTCAPPQEAPTLRVGVLLLTVMPQGSGGVLYARFCFTVLYVSHIASTNVKIVLWGHAQ